MTTFKQAVRAPETTTTTNGMSAFTHTGSEIFDLFFTIGASRNALDNAERVFVRAYNVDKTSAARTLFWARDVREGAGERATFRHLLKTLERIDATALKSLLKFVPEYGRWDDLLIFDRPDVKKVAYNVIKEGLFEENGLCAKWMPRKGPIAAELRSVLELTPKGYRKLLVRLTNVVEQKMCANDWTEINYSHVPSIAAKQYQRAFARHDEAGYSAYKEKLVTGEAKINASAIFPHDVLVALEHGDVDVAKAQWEALPNYLGEDTAILPMVDVSGSMDCPAGKGNTTCLNIAVALGLYISERQKGAFKDLVLTFSGKSDIYHLTGDIRSRIQQMNHMDWQMNTNIEKAFERILDVAVKNHVSASEMPKQLLILSDMQFDAAIGHSSDSYWQTEKQNFNPTMLAMARAKYAAAGYELPQIVFWNLNAMYGNVPATMNDMGVMLVSGYSPSLLKFILDMDITKIINSPRYEQIVL